MERGENGVVSFVDHMRGRETLREDERRRHGGKREKGGPSISSLFMTIWGVYYVQRRVVGRAITHMPPAVSNRIGLSNTLYSPFPELEVEQVSDGRFALKTCADIFRFIARTESDVNGDACHSSSYVINLPPPLATAASDLPLSHTNHHVRIFQHPDKHCAFGIHLVYRSEDRLSFC